MPLSSVGYTGGRERKRMEKEAIEETISMESIDDDIESCFAYLTRFLIRFFRCGRCWAAIVSQLFIIHWAFQLIFDRVLVAMLLVVGVIRVIKAANGF